MVCVILSKKAGAKKGLLSVFVNLSYFVSNINNHAYPHPNQAWTCRGCLQFTYSSMKSIFLLSALATSGAFASPAARKHSDFHHSKREAVNTYISCTAPRVNVFTDLSSSEKDSIYEFLDTQRNAMFVFPLPI